MGAADAVARMLQATGVGWLEGQEMQRAIGDIVASQKVQGDRPTILYIVSAIIQQFMAMVVEDMQFG